VGVERIELITDSAGAGRFRGGLGVRADYRILTDGVSATAVLSRYVVAPRGRAGGVPCATNHTVVIAEDGSEQVHGFETFPVVRGQVVSHRTGGGGGWGHAIRRDPAGSPPTCARGCSARRPRRNHGPAGQTAPVPGDGHVRR
jgi:N-methylhydantoinase B